VARLFVSSAGLRSLLRGAISGEKMNDQRDDREDQEEMNQESRHVVHDKAADPCE
jgi:hypothetical protein